MSTMKMQPDSVYSKKWKKYILDLSTAVETISFKTVDGVSLDLDKGFYLWSLKGQELKSNGNCLYIIGNGASASMSSHFAADIYKNAGIPTHVFTDLALITAIANDICYEDVFSFPLMRCARPGDMLLTISSSGNSPNILKAIATGMSLGMYVVTLSAMQPTNASRKSGHLNIYASAQTYGIAESAHAAILHYWTDILAQGVQSN